MRGYRSRVSQGCDRAASGALRLCDKTADLRDPCTRVHALG